VDRRGGWRCSGHRRLAAHQVNSSATAAVRRGPGPAGAWDAQYRSDWHRGLGDGLLAGAVVAILAAIALATAASAVAPAAKSGLPAPAAVAGAGRTARLAGALAVWSRRRMRALPPERLRAVLAARNNVTGSVYARLHG